MMEKSAQLGEGGECTPALPSFTISTITYKVVVYAQAERADTLPLLLLYSNMYSVVGTSQTLLVFPKKDHRIFKHIRRSPHPKS
jgi:hypothetical protein